jgi:hypothetical protein
MPKFSSLSSSVKVYGLTNRKPLIVSVTGSSANEGSNASFTVITTEIANGTSMSWSINHGTTNSSDFSATSGTFTISSNAGSFSISLVADYLTEGTENYTVTISGGGAKTLTSSSYNINDTTVTPAGISITYPSPYVTYGTAFSWSISGGYPNETWSSSWTGDFSGSASGSLNGSGSASYSDGSFGANYGNVTVSWTFSRSSGTYTKTIANQPPLPTVTYPSTVARYPSTFSWSMTGQPNETVSVSWTGDNSGSGFTFTLDASGSYNNGGTSYFVNPGSVSMTFTFNNSYRRSGSVVTKSITVT